MAELIIKNNQNIYDACLQAYGDLSYMDQLLADNSTLTYDAQIEPGTVIEYDETLGLKKINQERDTKDIIFTNGVEAEIFVLADDQANYIETDLGDLIEINL